MKLNQLKWNIRVAERTFEIGTWFGQTQHSCADYIDTEHEPDARLFLQEADLKREQQERIRKQGIQTGYGSVELLAVCRRVSEELLRFDTLLMHGAALAVGNEAYLFLAESGTGKTTHIQKWLEHLDNAFVVNGDKPFIQIKEKEALVCGSPWCGKEHLGTNTMVPLKAVVLMERAEENAMEKISFGGAFPMLLQQTYRPTDAEKLRKTLQLLSELGKRVSFYRFRFNNFKDNAFDVAYRALVEGRE